MPNETPFRSNCPISCALDLVGDKWSLLILRDMLFFNKQTFKELSSSPEGIASNILSNRLAKLEKCGIISKSAHPTNRKTKVYALKGPGLDLLPALLELFTWFSVQSDSFSRHVSDEETRILSDYRKDKEGFVREYRAKIEAGIMEGLH